MMLKWGMKCDGVGWLFLFFWCGYGYIERVDVSSIFLHEI